MHLDWIQTHSKPMYTTLAIIDVQDKFLASKYIINQVIHQIKLARRRKDGIVLVELGEPRSYDKIYKALHDYCKFVVVRKESNDGSSEVIDAIYENHYALDRIRLCGVNTCACVLSTLRGLMALDVVHRIEIASDAVRCQHNMHKACLTVVKDIAKGYEQ